jgi:hypothetical protein
MHGLRGSALTVRKPPGDGQGMMAVPITDAGVPMKILLAIDGSVPSLQAARWALDLTGQGLSADFVLVNVQ